MLPTQPPKRSGVSLIELQVALVVFAVALTGLYPLVMMQSKQLRKMESWLQPQTTYYLVPSTNEWARKLGAVAMTQTTDPGAAPAPGSSTSAYVVSVTSLERSLTTETVKAHVTVTVSP